MIRLAVLASFVSLSFSQSFPFTARQTFAVSAPSAAALADVNGDGRLDVLVGSSSTSTLAIMLGDGTGNFAQAPGSPLAVPETIHTILAGDFNGDNKTDVVLLHVKDRGFGTSIMRLSLSILLNNGSGGFTQPVSVPLFDNGLGRFDLIPRTFPIVAGDFDGDGDLDLQLATSLSAVFLKNEGGNIVYTPQQDYFSSFSAQVMALAAGYFDGDNFLDLAVSTGGLTPEANSYDMLYLGDGSGAFKGPGVQLASRGFFYSRYSDALQAADADGDGQLDLLYTSQASEPPSFGAYIRPPSGRITQAPSPGYYASPGLAVADFNHDGKLDGIHRDSSGNGVLRFGNGNGFVIAQGSPLSFNGPMTRIFTGDLDQDGWPDLVTLGGSGATAWTNNHMFGGVAQPQTIDFAPIQNRYVNSGSFSLTATASSGLPVTFVASPTEVCAVDGSVVSLLKVGTCGIAAKQPGNYQYLPATAVARTFDVLRAPQTVTLPSIPAQQFGTGSIPYPVSSTSGHRAFVNTNGWGVCHVEYGDTVDLIAITVPGTCVVNVNVPGDSVYISSTATATFEVLPSLLAPQSITFAPIAPRHVGGAPVPLVATASSGLPVAYSVQTPLVCAASENSLLLLAAGTCTVTAAQNGNATYGAATPVSQTFSIASPSQQTQTINFAPLPGRLFYDVPFTLSATATSGLPVFFSTSSPTVCKLEGNTIVKLYGSSELCVITAWQSDNGNFAPAAPVTRSFQVLSDLRQRSQITFPPIASHSLADAPFSISATASSGATILFYSLSSSVCSVAEGKVALRSVGMCVIQASTSNDGAYQSAYPVARVFEVTPVPPSTLRAQSIDFPPLPNRALSQSTSTLLYVSASSFLPVTFSTLTPSTCTVQDLSVQFLATGTCSIAANQAGNATYAPAPTVVQSFTISPSPLTPQVITFGALPNRIAGSAPFLIAVTTSSGLMLTVTTNTPSVCTLVGSTVAPIAPGICSITASQPGNATYTPASMTESFTVLPASTGPISPLITAIQEAGGYALGRVAPLSYAVVRGEHLLPSPQVKLREPLGAEYTLEQIFAVDEQINVVIPGGVALGGATIIVTNANGGAEFPVIVSAIAPGIFTANATGSGFAAAHAVVVKDGQNTTSLVADGPIPMQPGTEVFLVLYATGIRGHSPNGVTARIGTLPAEVVYAGPQGSYPAFDQINLKVPTGVTGLMNIYITVDGFAANVVTAQFQ